MWGDGWWYGVYLAVAAGGDHELDLLAGHEHHLHDDATGGRVRMDRMGKWEESERIFWCDRNVRKRCKGASNTVQARDDSIGMRKNLRSFEGEVGLELAYRRSHY